ARLSDAELVARVKSLAARERAATAELVAHLAELDTRDVHLREGYSSLFAYCRERLGLSEAEAYTRIMVARAARRFPTILEMLAAGAVNLTVVRLLAPYLTAENHRDVLESARGKGKEEVEKIRARLAPRPDVPTSIRRVPTARPEPAPAAPPPPVPLAPTLPMLPPEATPAPLAAVPHRPDATIPAETAVPQAPPTPVRASVTPLSPERYKLQLTIGGETLEKLRLAKDMLGHAIPSGDDAAILDRALTTLLVDLARKKFADTPRPRGSRGLRPGARCPSAAVKRAVWLRDLGRCAFAGANGRRCGERRFLEFHHVDPYVLGGEATVDGISLRCRRHNAYEATLYFGRRRAPDGAGSVCEEARPYGSRPGWFPYLFRNNLSVRRDRPGSEPARATNTG
ncbi:MAG TPA: DUF222 domain-containing protein, partial [Vicinamibacteria bacterium]|nr:DUF222 domain-containing protein [Vicinamibacteria bacterium]